MSLGPRINKILEKKVLLNLKDNESIPIGKLKNYNSILAPLIYQKYIAVMKVK